MTGRTWVVFCAVQLLGFIFANFANLLGQVETQNPVVMFPVLAGYVLLLPGVLLAMVLGMPSFLVYVAFNAIFWVACSAAWRKLRGKHQV